MVKQLSFFLRKRFADR